MLVGVRRLDAVLDTSVQDSPEIRPLTSGRAFAGASLDHRDRNSGIENGVEPPYAIKVCPSGFEHTDEATSKTA